MKKSYESPLFDEQKFQFADVISVTDGSGFDNNGELETDPNNNGLFNIED